MAFFWGGEGSIACYESSKQLTFSLTKKHFKAPVLFKVLVGKLRSAIFEVCTYMSLSSEKYWKMRLQGHAPN